MAMRESRDGFMVPRMQRWWSGCTCSLHMAVGEKERTRSIHQGMAFSFMSRNHRPVEHTEPTNPTKVQRANHRVHQRNGSSVDNGRMSLSMARLDSVRLASRTIPIVHSLESSLIVNNPDDQSWSRVSKMEGHPFIPSLAHWMDGEASTQWRVATLESPDLECPMTTPLFFIVQSQPSVPHSLARPQQQSILAPKAVHCSCCNTMKDDAHRP